MLMDGLVRVTNIKVVFRPKLPKSRQIQLRQAWAKVLFSLNLPLE
jgi:hypothetical protein